ncbi:hypothetical protein OEZ86_013922 [Tetradesmus obliquus]|nr:hypothetical protein OEZ86_013922 [Tetradesmus obliquus]
MLFDVNAARYIAASNLGQQDPAGQALSRARSAAEDMAGSAETSSRLCYQLAKTIHSQAVKAMVEPQEPEAAAATAADLAAAYELVCRARDCRAELGSAMEVLLCLGYCHLLHLRDAAACLKCCEALRQLETPQAAHPAVALLAFQAFMAQGSLEQAEQEATGIAVNDASSRDACLAVLLELLQAPEATAQLKPVLELVLGRFPADSTILTAFTEHALEVAAAAGNASTAPSLNSTGPAAMLAQRTGSAAASAAATAQQQQQQQQLLEVLVLEQLERAEEARTAAMKDEDLSYRLREALYNHAAGKFRGKDFQAAVKFFAATLEVCEERVKGRVARALAVCHLGLGQLSQSLSYCGIAEAYEPGRIATSFIRFKLLLSQGDQAGVLAELQHMARCSDFCHHMLWIAVKESNASSHPSNIPIAKAALQQLLALVQARRDGDASAELGSEDGFALTEADVLKTMVKVHQQELDDSMQRKAAAAEAAEAAGSTLLPDQQQQQAELQQLQASVEACISGLSEVLNTALQRLRRLGLEGFAGAGEEGSVLQLVEWLSTSSYNAGVVASLMDDYQGSAVLMHTSAQLMGLLPSQGPKQLKLQKTAYALAAAAGLQVHEAMPQHAGSLKLASKMLASSAAVTAKLGQAAISDMGAEAYDLQLHFRIALYQNNASEMVAVAGRMAEHPGVGHEYMFKLYEWSCKPPNTHPEVAVAALEGCLRKLMAVPQPNYGRVALVLRLLIQRASSDAAKLHLYREACGILSTLQPGAYPAQEAAWLVGDAWRCGSMHARFGRHSQAAAFMEVALELLPICPMHQQQKPLLMQRLEQERAAAAAAAGGVTAAVRPGITGCA